MNWDWDKLREQQQRQRRPGGGGDGPPEPPQLDDVIEQFKKFKGPGLFFIILVLVLLFGASTFYTIKEGEVGVIQRFGKYNRTAAPGPHFKLPSGIEKLTKIRVEYVYKTEFGYSGGSLGSREDEVSLMLTGDLNVAIVPWLVQFRIADPVKYLFNVEEPQRLLNDLAESSMRLVVGDRSVDEVIIKRDEIATACQELLQSELDEAKTGILVKTIEMQKTNVPGPVQSSFNEVNKAQQEKETMIYKANEEYNKAIPAAIGEAERAIRDAEGYALDKINRAKGEAARFTALYNEYSKAKDVTARRIYLEKVGEFLPKTGKKFIVDSKQKNLLPLLNLGDGKGQ